MTLPVFAVLSLLTIGSALGVILARNPVRSALCLVLTLFFLAVVYLFLEAHLVGALQIIVYAGAIMVLFLFVIMYLNLKHDIETGVQVALRRGIGWLLGALLILLGATLLSRGGWAVGPVSDEVPRIAGNTQQVGLALYSRYLFPFEITSIVLLVAMVGAIVISKGRTRPGGETP